MSGPAWALPVSEAWVWAWACTGDFVGLPNSQVLRGLPSKLSGGGLVGLTGNGAGFPWDSCQHGTSNSPWTAESSNSRNRTHQAQSLVIISQTSLVVIVVALTTAMGPAVSIGVRYLNSYLYFTVITEWFSNPGDLNKFWSNQLFLFVLIADMCMLGSRGREVGREWAAGRGSSSWYCWQNVFVHSDFSSWVVWVFLSVCGLFSVWGRFCLFELGILVCFNFNISLFSIGNFESILKSSMLNLTSAAIVT